MMLSTDGVSAMTDSVDGPFELQSRTLGALPVVQHFLDSLQLDDLLARYVPSSAQIQMERIRNGSTLGRVKRFGFGSIPTRRRRTSGRVATCCQPTISR